MSGPKTILIAGGGPAGALCGERLARAGFAVTIFEERPGWEKPCGGGVTWKTLERYPFLLDASVEKKMVREAEFIGSNGRRVRLPLSRPLAIYSRALLNSFLLRRAQAAGCTVVRQRAIAAAVDSCVRLRTPEEELTGDFLVIATGARNALVPQEALPPGNGAAGRSEASQEILRSAQNGKGAGWKPGPCDLEMTVGYYLPGEDDRIRVQFLDNFEGYLWSFPRSDHRAVGICGKMAQNSTAELREKLHRFMDAEEIARTGGSFYSHLLPSLARRSWKRLALASARWPAAAGWARIGDAAGLVDPITGEGIYYALRSGELLAEALIAGDRRHYPARVEKDFAAELRCAATWQPTFYRGRWPRLGRGWLGASTTARMLAAVERSPRFRRLLDDLAAGTQSYRGLKWRLVRLLISHTNTEAQRG